jgi:hypothetical protein
VSELDPRYGHCARADMMYAASDTLQQFSLRNAVATAGLDLLRAFGNVTTSDGMSPEELQSSIGQYDALIIRSASKARWCKCL